MNQIKPLCHLIDFNSVSQKKVNLISALDRMKSCHSVECKYQIDFFLPNSTPDMVILEQYKDSGQSGSEIEDDIRSLPVYWFSSLLLPDFCHQRSY